MFDKALELRYGSFKKEKDYFYNGVLLYYSNSSYLNILFNKSEYKNNISRLKENGIVVSESIEKFYKQYNGISLFSQSFVIYGCASSIEKGYTPLDMNRMNTLLKLKNRSWDNSYYAIGEYSNFAFCLKRNDKAGSIFVVEKRSFRQIRTFTNLDDFFIYCIEELSKLYDKDGYKKNRPSSSTSWLDNMSFENIF